jgi:hypothetical protein
MPRINILALASVASALTVVVETQVPTTRPAWAYAIPPQPATPATPDESGLDRR